MTNLGIFDRWIGWCIEQRLVVLVVTAGLSLGFLLVVSHASFDVLPNFLPPRVVVQTEAIGLGTTEVEELVTRPLERVLMGTPDTTSVRSTSSPGLSVITVAFDDSVDVYRARQVVTERIDLIRARLPSQVHMPQLAPVSSPLAALIKTCLTVPSDSDTTRRRDARTYVDWTVRPRLLAIPGVAQVTVHGGDVERFEVRPDVARLAGTGLTIDDVWAAVRDAQALGGAGVIENETRRTDVTTATRIAIATAPAAIENVVVTSIDGQSIRVGDVATVTRESEPRVGAALYDGRPAIYLQINKLPWADTVRVSETVESALLDLAAGAPAGVRFEQPVFRQAAFIDTSIRGVGRAMALGACLVAVVLFLFLRSGRLAIISLLAIPLSVLGATAALVGMGATINVMTLGGLAIAVGEVVDDAIVDVENVWRRLCENAPLATPRPALVVVREASREVRSSVVYATVIVCLVLSPVLALGDVAGRIFSPLAVAYILALTMSLVVALTVTPALCAFLLPNIARVEHRQSAFAERIVVTYRRLLRRCVDRPRFVLGGALGCAAIALGTLPMLGGRFLPEFHEGSLIAHVQAPPGLSVDEAIRIGRRIDLAIRPSEARHVAARIGRAELDEDAAPIHRLELDLMLPDGIGNDWEEITRGMTGRIESVPGLVVAVEGFLGERIHEVLAGETSAVVVKLTGRDLATMRRLATQITSIMGSIHGMGEIRPEPQVDVMQLVVHPDDTGLARFGIRPADVSDALQRWRLGRAAMQLLGVDGRAVDVVVIGAPRLRTAAGLGEVPVTSRSGGPVPLGAVARVASEPVPSLVRHEGGVRLISIGANPSSSDLSGTVQRLDRALTDRVALPPGYHIEIGGEAVARSDAAWRLLIFTVLVLVGIVVLLAVAFDSFRDAFIVLVNIPLGLVGGVAAAALSPEGLTVAGFVGFVALFGIIARNGIMLVAHKRHLDSAHPERSARERILQAAEERLLPILMTATTAGLGLLPLAFTYGQAGSEIEAPMAIIVCGGLLSSTVLNMLVLPTLYVCLDQREQWKTSPSPRLV